jgi:leucyl/phenylalanyl-tRNA--protein transferase
MVIKRFPHVSRADERGLLAVGGDLEPQSLLLAYRSGIFPWPFGDETLTWFSPPKRGVLFLDKFHISRSLSRVLKRKEFRCAIDSNFRGVIESCAEMTNRASQSGTWITTQMVEAYCDLFDLGYCHSFETYLGETLVGGVYGVKLGKFFAAESSFYRVANASKVAMCLMADYLAKEEIGWFDCQVLTPLSESFGAQEITREKFLGLLNSTVVLDI